MNRLARLGLSVATSAGFFATAFAQADFTGNVHLNSGISLSDAVVAYQYQGSNGILIGLLRAGSMGDGSVFTARGAFDGTDAYSLMGVFTDVTGAQHVAFTFADGSLPAVQDQSFDTVFGQTGVTEGQLIGLLDKYESGGDGGTLSAFYSQMCDGSVKPPPIFQNGAIVGFSNGTKIGEVQAVPEPASLLSAGALIPLFLKRRKR
jgi:hypothetical protein